MRATRIRPRGNRVERLRPYNTAVIGALPGGTSKRQRIGSVLVGIGIGAEEMRHYLHILPKELDEKCGLRPAIVHSPGRGGAQRQAHVALGSDGVSLKVGGVFLRRGDVRGCRWS